MVVDAENVLARLAPCLQDINYNLFSALFPTRRRQMSSHGTSPALS